MFYEISLSCMWFFVCFNRNCHHTRVWCTFTLHKRLHRFKESHGSDVLHKTFDEPVWFFKVMSSYWHPHINSRKQCNGREMWYIKQYERGHQRGPKGPHVPESVLQRSTCSGEGLTKVHMFRRGSYKGPHVPESVLQRSTCSGDCLTKVHMFRRVSYKGPHVPERVLQRSTCSGDCLTLHWEAINPT